MKALDKTYFPLGPSPAVLAPTSVETKVTGGFNAELPNASSNFIQILLLIPLATVKYTLRLRLSIAG